MDIFVKDKNMRMLDINTQKAEPSWKAGQSTIHEKNETKGPKIIS